MVLALPSSKQPTHSRPLSVLHPHTHTTHTSNGVLKRIHTPPRKNSHSPNKELSLPQQKTYTPPTKNSHSRSKKHTLHQQRSHTPSTKEIKRQPEFEAAASLRPMVKLWHSWVLEQCFLVWNLFYNDIFDDRPLGRSTKTQQQPKNSILATWARENVDLCCSLVFLYNCILRLLSRC